MKYFLTELGCGPDQCWLDLLDHGQYLGVIEDSVSRRNDDGPCYTDHVEDLHHLGQDVGQWPHVYQCFMSWCNRSGNVTLQYKYLLMETYFWKPAGLTTP